MVGGLPTFRRRMRMVGLLVAHDLIAFVIVRAEALRERADDAALYTMFPAWRAKFEGTARGAVGRRYLPEGSITVEAVVVIAVAALLAWKITNYVLGA